MEAKLQILLVKNYQSLLKDVEKKIKIAVYQQCTNDQIKKLKKYYSELKIKHEVFNFKKNLHNYFKKIDICITRAGSSMLAELVNCRVPFISIPLPNSADNHQFLNAEYFKKKKIWFFNRGNRY